MKFYNQELLNCLPKGADIVQISLNPLNSQQLIVNYKYNDKEYQVIPDRINLLEKIKYRQGFLFYFEEGMTVNFLYELLSTRHELGLIEGEDYESQPELVSFQSKVMLPIRPLSLRYLPTSLPIELVMKNEVFIGDESMRNLLNVDCNPFKDSLRKRLLQLGTFLMDGRSIVCFNKNHLSPDFVGMIISKAAIKDETLIQELLYSKAIGVINDGLSDVVIMSGPNVIHYLIRFISNKNDLPKL